MDISPKHFSEWFHDFHIETLEDSLFASNGKINVLVLEEEAEKRKLVNKRRIHIGNNRQQYQSCLLAELNGVKVYISKGNIVVTEKELLT